MKRPRLVRVLVALQVVTAFASLAIAAAALWKTRDPKLIAEGAETIHGLYLGAAIVGGAALVFLAGGVLLWKRWRIGWWMAMAMNLLMVFAFAYDPLFEHEPFFSEDTPLGLWFVVSVVLLFLPAVRRFVFRRAILSPAEAGSVS